MDMVPAASCPVGVEEPDDELPPAAGVGVGGFVPPPVLAVVLEVELLAVDPAEDRDGAGTGRDFSSLSSSSSSEVADFTADSWGRAAL
jgi:hypothetical protein